MSSFYIVALIHDHDKPRKDDGTYHLKEHPLNDYGPYDTGKEAAAAAKRASTDAGYKCQPRRFAEAGDAWIEREKALATKGIYGTSKLPKDWPLTPIENHFAVIQNKMISYFPDAAAGVLNKRVTTKVGRYLEQFYPHLGDAEKRQLTALIDPPEEVLFATTAEEIVKIYTNGPDSCMAKTSQSKWGTDSHPAEFYAAGDLAVAYLKKGKERASARAVCWPEKKQFGRLYGDVERLRTELLKLGYRHVDVFVGAKVNPIPHPKYRSTPDRDEFFMTPYFDNVQTTMQTEDGTWVTTTHSEAEKSKHRNTWFVGSGDTVAIARRRRYCERMQSLQQGPFLHVHGIEKEWSQYAVNHYAFLCQGSNTLWPKDRKYQVELENGVMWSVRHFEQHGFTCAATGVRRPIDQAVTLQDGRKVTREYARKLERMAAQSGAYADVVAAQRAREARAISNIVVPQAEAPTAEVEKPKRTRRSPVFADVPTHPGPAISTSSLSRRRPATSTGAVTFSGVTIGL